MSGEEGRNAEMERRERKKRKYLSYKVVIIGESVHSFLSLRAQELAPGLRAIISIANSPHKSRKAHTSRKEK